MSTSIFQVAEAMLRRALPKLINEPWDKYGEGIQLVDAGVKKYQGMMVAYQPKPSIWVYRITMGRLPDQVESRKTVESKIQTLRDHSEGLSSIEFRDPPRVWGGAVRNHEGDLWGLTGLPEIVDHLVMTHTLFYCGSLSQGLRERLLGTDCEGVVSAMGHARMDLHSYKKLVLLTGDIIAAAA